MYNTKDTQFAGKHDYDKEGAMKYAGMGSCKTFSIGIFKWEMKSKAKEMKRGKIIVRVSGSVTAPDKVVAMAEHITIELDANKWNGKKNVTVK